MNDSPLNDNAGDRGAVTERFEAWWKTYPGTSSGNKGPKAKALVQWKKLSDDDRERAAAAVATHLARVQAAVASRDPRAWVESLPHAHRYLRDRRFEEAAAVTDGAMPTCSECHQAEATHDPAHCPAGRFVA